MQVRVTSRVAWAKQSLGIFCRVDPVAGKINMTTAFSAFRLAEEKAQHSKKYRFQNCGGKKKQQMVSVLVWTISLRQFTGFSYVLKK